MSSSTNNKDTGTPEKKYSVNFEKTVAVGQTRWLRLESIKYNDGKGEERPWDRCVRTTKKSEEDADAVIILAILRYNDANKEDKVVTVKQFRPPVNAFTIELPAGLVDNNKETVSDAALRELYEETGYVGAKVISVSSPVVMSPGLTNESVCVVKIEVDMTDPKNQSNDLTSKNENLDSSEEFNSLQTLLLPKVGLLNELNKLQSNDDIKIFGMLYTLALALELE